MEILIENLHKQYGSVQALRGINLRIEDGMYGLLGPNGAGKTTLLRILATLIHPTSGRVVIGAYDLAHAAQKKAVRAQLGYLPQELGLYPDLSGRELLDYMGLLKRLYDRHSRRNQMASLLDMVGLTQVADRKIKTYSGGMKRRLGIAQALLDDPRLLIIDEPTTLRLMRVLLNSLGDPRLLIIDEPTAGLDPEERIRLRTLLTKLAQQRVVILSTHVVEDISQTCDQVAVLNMGELAFQGRTRQLVEAAQGYTWQFMADTLYTPPATLSVISILPQAGETLYRVVGPRPEGAVRNVEAVVPTLEDGYVWLRQQHAGGKVEVRV